MTTDQSDTNIERTAETNTPGADFVGEPSLNDYYTDKNLARDILLSIPVGAVAGALTAIWIVLPLLPPVMNPQRVAVATFLLTTGIGIATAVGMTAIATTAAAIILRYYGTDPRPRCWRMLQTHRINDDRDATETGGEDR